MLALFSYPTGRPTRVIAVTPPVVGSEPGVQQHIPANEFYPASGTILTGGGATGFEVHRTNVEWVHLNVGDWADANGASQGSTAYGSAVIGAAAISTTFQFPVTTLVQQWVNGVHDNHGFFIKKTSVGGFCRFHSNEATTSSNRPKLVVTKTDATVVEFAVTSDTRITATLTALGATEVDLQISGSSSGLLWFDLSSLVSGSVQSASLVLRTTANAISAVTVGAFRTNLDPLQAPITYESGLADSYLNDASIASDTDVVYAEDFDDFHEGNGADLDQLLRDKGWVVANYSFAIPAAYTEGTEGQCTIVGDTDPLDANYVPLFPGCKAVRAELGQISATTGLRLNQGGVNWKWPFYGNTGPVWDTHNVARGEPLWDGRAEEPVEIYERHYVRLGNSFEPRKVATDGTITPEAGKFFGGFIGNYDETFAGTSTITPVPPGGPYNRRKPHAPSAFGGNSSDRSFTCSGYSLRGHFGGQPAVEDTPFLQAGWRRLEMQQADWSSCEDGFLDGSVLKFSGGNLGLVKKNTWHCVETRVKMNSIDTTGATKAYVGYPWGGLYSGAFDVPRPNGMPLINATERENNCQATGTASTIVLDASASSVTGFYNNYAVFITSRSSEIRRITAYNGTTKVATIAAHDGSSATWSNIPQSAEQFRLVKNTSIKERTTLYYGDTWGHIYADENSVIWGTTLGIPASLQDTAILQSEGIGRRDGIRQIWIDGRLAYSETDVWWRSIREIQIEGVWWTFFMGGSNPVPVSLMNAYFTKIVCAKRYIGPMRITESQGGGTAPQWVQSLDPFELYSIPNTTIQTDYEPTTNFPIANFWRNLINAECGCAVRTENSTVIVGWGGGHADGSYNQIVELQLEAEVPGWEEYEPGSALADVPTGTGFGGSPFAGVPYYVDGRPAGCHNYDRLQFINSEDRLVRIQSPAVWSTGSPTFQDCASFHWPTKTFHPAAFFPTCPWSTGSIVQDAVCKDPSTENIYAWHATQIWKWTRISNAWTLFKSGTGVGNHGAQEPMACNGDQVVSVFGNLQNGVIYALNLATTTINNYNVATGGITGPDTIALDGCGTRCRLLWIPPLNKYFFQRGKIDPRPGICQGGTATTITLDNAGDSNHITNNRYLGQKVWINSRPTEVRRITAYNGTTKVATITSLDGSPDTWTNIPIAGETFTTVQRDLDKIYSIHWTGTSWHVERLTFSGEVLPAVDTLGPTARMNYLPNLNAVVYLHSGTRDALFFKVA